MTKMKRAAALALSACMVASMVTGCGDSGSASNDSEATTAAAVEDTAADDTAASAVYPAQTLLKRLRETR